MSEAVTPLAPVFLKLLVLGAPKIGKTQTCISTAPEGGVFVINSDQPDATIPARRLRKFDEAFVEHPQDFQNAMSRIRKGVKEGVYSTVVWDTVSEFGRKVQYLCEDEDKDGRKAWGRLARFVCQGVDQLIRLNCHVVILAHSVMGEEGLELDMPGQSGRRVPAAFNDVWEIVKRGDARVFSKKKGGVLNSRTLPNESELSGDVSQMVKRIQGGK